MAVTRCGRCGSRAQPAAKFCIRCGASFGAAPAPPVAAPPGRPVPEPPRLPRGDAPILAPEATAAPPPAVHCENCGAPMPEGAEACEACGALGGAPQQPGRPPAGDLESLGQGLPPRRIRRPASGDGAARARLAASGRGAASAYAGSALVLLGGFLPLVQGAGFNDSLMSAGKEFGYVYLVPLSAVAIALMAWGSTVGTHTSRVSLGGGVIALSSPWLVFWVLAILAAARVISAFGWYAFGTNVGIGVIVLAVGFAACLGGGFAILVESVQEQRVT